MDAGAAGGYLLGGWGDFGRIGDGETGHGVGEKGEDGNEASAVLKLEKRKQEITCPKTLPRLSSSPEETT